MLNKMGVKHLRLTPILFIATELEAKSLAGCLWQSVLVYHK